MAVANTTAYNTTAGGKIRGGRAAPRPAYRNAMAPLTWANIGNVWGTVDPAQNPAINPNYPAAPPWRDTSIGNSGFIAMISYSGAAHNPARDELTVMGEGHTDGYGNQLPRIALNAESPTWFLETWPTGAIGNKLHPDSTPGALVTMIGDGHAAWVSGKYSDGRPRGNHTYNNMCFVGDDLYVIVGGAAPENGFNGHMFKYSAITRDWTELATLTATIFGSAGGGVCYDPTRNALFYFSIENTNVAKYDIATDTWSSTTQSVNSGAYHRPNYIPELDLIVTISQAYTNRFAVYDYGRTSSVNIPTPAATGTPPSSTNYTGVWVPSLGAIVVWGGGTGFYLLKPPVGATAANAATGTWAWSRLEAAAGNTVTPSAPAPSGTYGRFFYSPNLNMLGVINTVTEQIYGCALD